ncbi:hypothetical protein CCMSSC00406_0009518 [Pleurotus cornucopiae]|uniref:Uncharacterized protein n=1 Tax=Pleurotus cornucopiae TaxID=5321 RepID=A0ACB7IQD4_PLECO|nr:hypothetical protein CCMSSC00406_0009518 [Pleurotus cornucopiae]
MRQQLNILNVLNFGDTNNFLDSAYFAVDLVSKIEPAFGPAFDWMRRHAVIPHPLPSIIPHPPSPIPHPSSIIKPPRQRTHVPTHRESPSLRLSVSPSLEFALRARINSSPLHIHSPYVLPISPSSHLPMYAPHKAPIVPYRNITFHLDTWTRSMMMVKMN